MEDRVPTFLLAGGTKAGTTSLYECFQRSGCVNVAVEKEPHYFSRGFFGANYEGFGKEIASWDTYLALYKTDVPNVPTGDFDPLTLHGPNAAALIRQANPEAKIVLILRNPIERAYSHYWMDFRECFESRNFLETVKAAVHSSENEPPRCRPLLDLGFYSKQVAGLQRAMLDGNVRVWLYEDFSAHSDNVLGEIKAFLGILAPSLTNIGAIRENVAGIPRSRLAAILLRARVTWLRPFRNYYIKLPKAFRTYIKKTLLTRTIPVPAMPPEAREILASVYKDDILELGHLLKRDLTSWLRNPSAPLDIPPEFKGLQKANQARFFDESLDDEFEVERPSGSGRLYKWCIESKYSRAFRLLNFDLSGQSVLDLCCGSGMGSEIFAKAGASVTGIDISEKSIARATERQRRHHFQATFLVGDAEHLPFNDNSFDVVTVHDGLHHLPDPLKAVQEMCRVARRAVIVIEPARSWLTRQAVNVGAALDFEEAGNYVFRFRESDVYTIAQQAGFGNCTHEQYLLYYQHQPFAWAKRIERTPLFFLFPAFFGFISFLAPRLGNKICIVCEKSAFQKRPRC